MWPLVIHSINVTLGRDSVLKLSLSGADLLLHWENCAVLRVPPYMTDFIFFHETWTRELMWKAPAVCSLNLSFCITVNWFVILHVLIVHLEASLLLGSHLTAELLRWEVRLVQLWSGKIISVQTVCALSIRVFCTSCPLNMNSLGQCKSSVLLSHVQLFKEKLQGGKRDIIQTAWAIGAVALFWEQPKAAERMHTVHKSYPYWVPCGKDFTSLTANVTAHS